MQNKFVNMNKKISLVVIKIVFLVLATSMMWGCRTTQVIISEDSKKMERIIDVPNLSKDALYIKVNSWFVENFNSAESVIEFQDKEAGKIIGKYEHSYTYHLNLWYARQTVSVDIKDNRIRFIISDPYHTIDGNPYAYVKYWNYVPVNDEKTIKILRPKWEKLATSLQNYVQTKDNDNW
jgi:hypothetical protein